jgi:HK97 gp10 family phage protein
MSLELVGLQQLRESFAQLRQDVRGEVSRKAVRAGAVVFQEAISTAAPVLDRKTAESTAQDPGALKGGIEIRISQDRLDGFLSAEVGPKNQLSHVAFWVEFGHFLVKGGTLSLKRAKLQGRGHRVGWVEQHAFIRPATDASSDAALEAYAETMAEWLKGMAA